MQFAAWDARLSAATPTGGSLRANLEVAASHGNAAAIQQLTPPPFPDALAYLWDWFSELAAGLGEGLHGPASLTWVALDAWARRTGTAPRPDEVKALFTLDAVTRNPDMVPPPDDDEEQD